MGLIIKLSQLVKKLDAFKNDEVAKCGNVGINRLSGLLCGQGKLVIERRKVSLKGQTDSVPYKFHK